MSPLQFEPLPPVPAVTLARKLRESPIFRYASVDELFRISSISRQVRYGERSIVQERGAPAEYIQFLLQGKLRLVNGTGEERTVGPPVTLGFQEVLRGSTLQEDASAAVDSIALVMPAEEFRTLLAANIELAQGLFRTLLEPEPTAVGPSKRPPSPSFHYLDRGEPLKTVEKAMYLQTIPIFSRATGEEIYQVATVAREIALARGATVFSPGNPAAIVFLLQGRLSFAPGEGAPVLLHPGEFLGVRETLAGASWNGTVSVDDAGRALQIDREPLYDLLSDRLDLLQGIFSAIFHGRESPERDE